MDNLLAKLSEQQVLLEKQKNALLITDRKPIETTEVIPTLNTDKIASYTDLDESTSGSVPLTPATDSFNETPDTEDSDEERTIKLDPAEMLRLKKELDAAKDKIARQEQELSQARNSKPILDSTKGPNTAPLTAQKSESIDRTISNAQDAFNAVNRSYGARQELYGTHEDARSDNSDPLSAGAFNRAQGIWPTNPGPGYNAGIPNTLNQPFQQSTNIWGQGSRPWMNRPMAPPLAPLMVPQHQQMQHRAYSGPTSPVSGGSNHFGNDFNTFQGGQGLRRSNTQNSRTSASYTQGRNNGWDTFGHGTDGSMMNMSPVSSFQPMGMFQAPMSYQPRPIGTPLSPTAAEFTSNNPVSNPWNSAVCNSLQKLYDGADIFCKAPSSPIQTYVSPMEPLNYRRLLDRSVTCNWKYIVDKIVCNNDQQASIFLQQKLKVGTAEQKFEIVEAIVAQAYPLMVNRFGNFLVQRCFEHGTPEQVISIANAIRGNTLSLSMDAFGCHVVQKAFDAVPEDYKAIMVHELLRRIPETVIHRYACHVWQKLFELRWSDSPPQIMKYVNEALRGMWHEVALGETGSLVVQNIFENCLEEDKVSALTQTLRDKLTHALTASLH